MFHAFTVSKQLSSRVMSRPCQAKMYLPYSPQYNRPPIEPPQLYSGVIEDHFLFKTLFTEWKSDHFWPRYNHFCVISNTTTPNHCLTARRFYWREYGKSLSPARPPFFGYDTDFLDFFFFLRFFLFFYPKSRCHTKRRALGTFWHDAAHIYPGCGWLVRNEAGAYM